MVGDFERHLGQLPRGGRRLVVFLGGTIGNFAPADRKRFLADLADGMAPGDRFLLGTDLVKDVARLEAAYDDAAGVTAEFNLNVLAVVNRELDADFDLDQFVHVARFDPARGVDRDAAALTGRPDRAGARARSGGVVRGRRGDAHRDQRQVPAAPGWKPSWPRPGSGWSGG